MSRKRYIWVDIVKLYACILVALGHFFQSMVSAEIIQSTHLYNWFNSTIYFFHVPLFFICSGYLYQATSVVETFAQWKNTVLKKALAFGVPYFVFSVATWVLKNVFSGSVNSKPVGLAKALFLAPMSPYWYLYALFFVFCITLTIKNKREAVCLAALAMLMKIVSLIWTSDISLVKYLLENEIWFVLGMLISFCKIPTKFQSIKNIYVVLLGCVFVIVSVFVYVYPVFENGMSLIMGLFGCVCTLLIAINFESIFAKYKIFTVLANYTLPIFLMHTIFAAGIRSVLFKIGISNSVVHIAIGIAISFLGPILAAIIMKKLKWAEFLLYPTKFIKIGSKTKN